jgi:hypothetical protein
MRVLSTHTHTHTHTLNNHPTHQKRNPAAAPHPFDHLPTHHAHIHKHIHTQLLARGQPPATLPDPTMLKPDPAVAPTVAAAVPSPPSSPTGKKGGSSSSSSHKKGKGQEGAAAAAYLVRSVDQRLGPERAVRQEGPEASAWGPKLEVRGPPFFLFLFCREFCGCYSMFWYCGLSFLPMNRMGTKSLAFPLLLRKFTPIVFHPHTRTRTRPTDRAPQRAAALCHHRPPPLQAPKPPRPRPGPRPRHHAHHHHLLLCCCCGCWRAQQGRQAAVA